MNKTLIALAIAATLPVAAVADVTISGSLNTKLVSLLLLTLMMTLKTQVLRL
jgi:hypothetical protein